MPKMVKYVKKANHLQGANAQSATTKAYSNTMAGAKKGGRRWSPPGVTIKSAVLPKGGQRVLDPFESLSTSPISKAFLISKLERAIGPLS